MPRDLRGTVVPLGVGVLLLGVLLFYVGALRHTPAEAAAVVVLAALAAALLPWAVVRTGRYAQRAWWASTPRQESAAPTALDYRLVRIRRDLRDAVERDDRVDPIFPVLHELTAERLRARHGVDLGTQPERARELLDPHLWRYLSAPPSDTRKRSRSALNTAVEGIEKL